MRSPAVKWAIAAACAVILVIAAVIVIARFRSGHENAPESQPSPSPAPAADLGPKREVIGKSVEGREIEAISYGRGPTRLVFAGGMHGGYEWNSVLLAYQFKDYLDKNPGAVPANLTVTVIPDINPDGVYKATGKTGRFTAADVSPVTATLEAARFNAHNVDLNRNFACRWQPESTWRSKTVSAGTAPFSEPEAAAIRDFALKYKPAAFTFWHSQSNAVYASECGKGILPRTLDAMNAYAKASGYPAVKSFDAYPVTGDSEGWLASINIPAITVELSTHATIEWERNLAGAKALISLFSTPIK